MDTNNVSGAARAYIKILHSAAVFILIGLSVLLAQTVGVVRALDNALVDVRFRLEERNPTQDIVLVDIDSRSLAEIGVWPWPRELHGSLVNAASRLGAARLAFDVDFSASATTEGDRVFAEALSHSKPETFLAAFVQKETVDGGRIRPNLPIETLLQHSWPAMVNVPVDSDGKVRRFPFAVQFGEENLAAMATVLSGNEPSAGEFGIDYSIDPERIARISYVDLVHERVSKEKISGKTLIVGATALELSDLFMVPVHGIVSGSTVLALATETLLQGRALEYVSPPWYLLVGLGLFAGCSFSLVRSPRFLAGLVGFSLATEGVAVFLQLRHGIVFSTASVHFVVVGFAIWAIAREFDVRGMLVWIARIEVTNSEHVLQRVIEDGFDGIVILDDRDRIVRFNKAAIQLLDLAKPARIDDLPAALADSIRACRREAEKGSVACRNPMLLSRVAKDANDQILEYTIAPVGLHAISDSEEGNATFICLTIRDVTERHLAHEQMRSMALHDSLTGLSNRRALELHLDNVLSRTNQSEGMALLCFDLDRFKAVNDSLGHAIGDGVLVETARRAEEVLGRSAFVARTGGDEFAALIPADSAESAEACAAELAAAIAQSFSVADHNIFVESCVGISWWEVPTGSGDMVMRQADAALCTAKRSGLHRVMIFQPFMDEQRLARLALERQLEAAFENDEFHLVYQPQLSLGSREIVGAEALLRWHHPTQGSISPAEFIPVAEEMGLIHRLGAWVLATACRDAAEWPVPIKVAVNVSAIQFETGNLVAAVQRAIGGSGLSAKQLELEITESAFVKESERLTEIFDQLLAIGVEFSLDDFGTGYSSLGYLHRFPISKIKIDRSFVGDLPSDKQAMAILRSIRALSDGLGIPTVAEGIESEAQAQVLHALGCDIGQGYFFSRPVSAQRLASLLDERFVIQGLRHAIA